MRVHTLNGLAGHEGCGCDPAFNEPEAPPETHKCEDCRHEDTSEDDGGEMVLLFEAEGHPMWFCHIHAIEAAILDLQYRLDDLRLWHEDERRRADAAVERARELKATLLDIAGARP